MRRHLASLLAGLAVLALLAGCGDDGDEVEAENTTTAPAEDPVAGRTFEATAVEGEAPPIVEGAAIRIAFDEEEVTVDAGCSPITGPYTIEGPILVIEEMDDPEGCTPGLVEQGAWIVAALVNRPAITPMPPDGLVLSSKTWTITMTEVDLDAEVGAELLGPDWMLDTLIDDEGARTVPAGITAMVHLAPDGAYQLHAGCNGGVGHFTPPGGGETIDVGTPALTRQRCDETTMEVEATFVEVFEGSLTVAIEGDRLTLTDADGHGLSFTAG